jgi:hypothetical protein
MAKAKLASLESVLETLIRVAASRGNIGTRIDRAGVEVTINLPSDLVSSEILEALFNLHKKDLLGKLALK